MDTIGPFQMNAVRYHVAFSLFVCGLMGCDRTVRLDEVTGTYVMNRGVAHDTLVVRADSSYHRVYVRPGVTPVIDSGRWSTTRVDEDTYLEFDGFPLRWRAETFPSAQRDKPGLWPVIPERSIGGQIRLPVDDDIGWAYVQVTRR